MAARAGRRCAPTGPLRRVVERRTRLPLLALREELAEEREGTTRGITSAKLKRIDGCNLRCFMCDYWRGRREAELTTQEVCRILSELAALGCQKVHFTGGEIMLRRDAVVLFAHAAELGMRVNLTTNGTVLDKARARAMLELPVRRITLSLDSPVRKIHDRVRGREGAYKKTLRSLDYLLRHRGKKTKLALNVVVSRATFASLIELPELLARFPVDDVLLIPMDDKPANQRPGVVARLPLVEPPSAAMTADEIRRYGQEVAPVLTRGISLPHFDPFVFGPVGEERHSAVGRHARGYYEEHRCHVPWHHVLIGATGDVYPCCMAHRSTEPLGNVREESLTRIWQGTKYAAFRRRMLEQRMAVCQRCDDFLADNRALNAQLVEVSP